MSTSERYLSRLVGACPTGYSSLNVDEVFGVKQQRVGCRSTVDCIAYTQFDGTQFDKIGMRARLFLNNVMQDKQTPSVRREIQSQTPSSIVASSSKPAGIMFVRLNACCYTLHALMKRKSPRICVEST